MSGKVLVKDMKIIQVLVLQNNFAIRICTLDMPQSSSNQDELFKEISKTIFSIDMILKDEKNGYRVVFKDGTVRQMQMTLNDDPYYKCDYKISILPAKTVPCHFYNYGNLLNNKLASDITISVGGKEILAHKLILSTRSPVFWGLLMHEKCKPGRLKYEINDVDYDTMYDLLHFLYTGEFKDTAWLFSDDIVYKCSKLLKADSIYYVAKLNEECEQRLMSILSTDNLIDCLILADKYNMFSLRETGIKSLAFQIKEFPELLSGKFETLQSQLLVDIVKALAV